VFSNSKMSVACDIKIDFTSRRVAKPSTGPSQIARRQLRHSDALGGFLYDVPNRLYCHAIVYSAVPAPSAAECEAKAASLSDSPKHSQVIGDIFGHRSFSVYENNDLLRGSPADLRSRRLHSL
jgi:hypothetical protein